MKIVKGKLKSIRSSTLIILIIVLIMQILTITFALRIFMLSSIQDLEQRYIAEHMKRAEDTLNSEIQRLSQVAFDWAVWNDTYEFIEDKNSNYIESNLTDSATLSNLKVNAMIFINQNGEYIFGKEIDIEKEKEKEIQVSPNLISIINNSQIHKNINPEIKIQGIVLLPEGPMMIVSCPILLSTGEGPVRGNIVIGQFIDDTEVSYLSKITNLNIVVQRLDKLNAEQAKPYNEITQNSPISIRKLDSKKIDGYSILKDINGKPIIGINIEMTREISIIGMKGIDYVLLTLIIFSFIFTFLIMLFLDKNFIIRLLELSNEIEYIGNQGIFSLRLKAEKRADELTVVSQEINNMLDKLEMSQVEIMESKEALKIANNDLENRVNERTSELMKANESLRTEIVEREKIQREIEYLAYHDPLTGLSNRLFFSEQLNHAVLLSNRIEKMLAVIFLDLDDFKIVNDTMGHAIGDQLLVEVSKRLIKSFRANDLAARIGGDEFIIMIENVTNCDMISVVASKILKSFNKPFIINNQDFFITASIGVAVYPIDGKDAETLIKNADIAMYKAKENGRNQFVICNLSMKDKVVETMKLSNRLYRAMERNEFEIYYQPQVNSNTNKIIGLEALLRWKHHELGMISPAEFIPIAEQTGLIIPIGAWVMLSACKQNKIWQDAGLPKVPVAVNLSIKQFQDTNIINQVKEVLMETGLEARYLELEITESIAMKETGYVVDTLDAFRNMGISISIDDFGTEYSSLKYLKQMSVDKIKIDMHFVHGIGLSHKDEAIINAIIIMSKSMGLRIIAEGVETEKQISFLAQRGCEELQGFYYYKPIPSDEVEEVLKNNFLI